MIVCVCERERERDGEKGGKKSIKRKGKREKKTCIEVENMRSIKERKSIVQKTMFTTDS